MKTKGTIDIDVRAVPPKMPIGYRLLSWLLFIDALVASAYVWSLVFAIVVHGKRIDWFQAGVFVPLLVGYHLLLLFWTLVGSIMQSAWRTLGSVSLFPIVFVISTFFLNVAAVQLAVLVYLS